MENVLYDSDADLGLLEGKTIAILGYGSQGHAHALNLRDSGCDVVVGLPPNSASRARAERDGLPVLTPIAAVAAADVVMVLVPDTKQPQLYREAIEPHPASTRARRRPYSSPMASTCASAPSPRRRTSTSPWLPPRRPAIACASSTRRAPARRR